LCLCYHEDRRRLGTVKLEKLRFSFVSALTLDYLCSTKIGGGSAQPNLKNFVFRLSLRSPFAIFAPVMRLKLTFFLYICLCMVSPAIAQMPIGNPIYGTDAYGNPVDANGNPVQLDANGNPIVDGYGNDAYTWGRDTTQAEEKIIPIGSYAWNIDERFGNITPVDVDTLPNNFQNFNLTAGPTGQYNFLGNLGSPRLSRLFMDRKPYSNFIFADPFDYFYTPVNEFQFTNTLSPITNLSYHSCGNKQDGEDRLRAYFASNINKISGIGFKLDYLYGRGYYNNQATSLFNGSLYGYYLDDRYNMHAWISVNHMRMGENGGIENDDYITHPEDFTRSYGSRDIPTILSENWNRNEDQTYYLTHRYNLGFYKDIELPDSLRPVMPADSVLLKGLRDSLLTVYQKADTAYQHAVMDSLRDDFMAQQDNPQDFIPVTSFIHTLRIRNAKHTVYSYDTPDHYYADLFYGDPNNMSDRTRGYSIQNTLGIALREGFNKWAKAGLTAFASHEYRHYTMPDLNGGNKIIRSYSENNISVGGQLSKREGKTLHYDMTGEVTLLGEDVGQFDVEGRADLNFRLFKDTVQLAARAFVKNLNPSFYMRHYHSQFAWWDNDLNKEFRTRIEGTLSLKRTRTALTVGVENIKNYAYFATDKIAYNDEGGQFAGYSNRISVKQYGGSVQVFSARLNQNFKFGILHWDNEVAYQKTSNQDILPLPDLSAYSNLYIVFRIAKVLRVQLGGDVRYFTEYYAPDYAPIIQQFTVQSPETRMKLGNYPICNAYVNLFLKHCRFYVNVNHVNNGTGNKNAFLVPHYPINPMNIHFGLSWNFFN